MKRGSEELPDWSSETLGDPSLEGGELERITSTEKVVETVNSRPKREIRPVVKLSYDYLGQPTNRPLTLIHRGMVINVESGEESEGKACNTMWCHPMAQCVRCTRVNPSTEPKVTIKVLRCNLMGS